MNAASDALQSGAPYPLGATYDGCGVNFAVFSANATRIELCLFDRKGRREVARHRLPEYTDEVWHGYLPGASPGLLYGYRAFGPHDPHEGHRFNPHKLLVDPYARELTGDLRWTDALFGYRLNSPRADLSFDRRDSASAMPKCRVIAPHVHWPDDHRPDIPPEDVIVMEAHLKGLSMRHPDVPQAIRGTFQALSHPRIMEHLTKLGITTLELLPMQAFITDRFLIERGVTNYWGYNTLAFFAPHPAYMGRGEIEDFRVAIRALHAAGIEVVMDVVYNHTCEGNELGPTLCYRGLDNASYYRLVPDDERHYINDTGCGNTLNLSHPRVLQMVLDSLRHWASAFNIDGFRFDLATILGRENYGYDQNSGFLDALMQDPILRTHKLIAEPWDPGPGGYQVGNFPPGFHEWNDRFRDTTRRFWRQDECQQGDMAARLSGSGDIFDHRGRRPWTSVNFVTAHDGFTLMDTVSYEIRHNEANKENNHDGAQDNHSRNWGEEGPTDDATIVEKRDRIRRAMMATLLLAHGIPMILAGDEFGQTQNGNNNAYCQDNDLSWLDWSLTQTPRGQDMQDFTARLILLRREHPSLRAQRYMHGRHAPLPDLSDIAWFNAAGQPMSVDNWNEGGQPLLGLRRAIEDGESFDITYTILNPSDAEAPCALPPPTGTWRLLLDSARLHHTEPESLTAGLHSVIVAAHSVLLLQLDPATMATKSTNG
ncbi:glycogen debranching protein [Acetobacter estunensis NRIC 0472]|uniref:Glycogen debranching protein GlgX n=1 Tax=Acetobacter estunensis TaxID=104097 RepID=A0A967ECT8_9PROT|nr:glycogen debranching protein GlgX [Acetobacter estunensis]NHO53275.1 glycogen debranching protein GlgX [Acetobacter estunensis]GBQ23614.1 glycogen debranching protein [Acetobacter estunensis NRIC 0472]